MADFRNSPPQRKLGYILKGFARTSETFITHEIALIEKRGIPLEIFSILELDGQRLHAVVESIHSPVHYLQQTTNPPEGGTFAWLRMNLRLFLPRHGKLFRSHPFRYLKTFFETVGMCFRYRKSTDVGPNSNFLKEFVLAGEIAHRVLEAGSIAHLHSHFCHTSTTIAMLTAALSGLPFSFTAHAKDIYALDQNPGDLLARKIERAKFVVTCTEANRVHLESLNSRHRPILAIYHGVDLREFGGGARKETTGRPLILSAGRKVEKKGFPDLLEACRILKDRGEDFEMQVIGGGGPLKERIEALVNRLNLRSTVQLRDAVTQEELRKIYSAGTFFVLPCRIGVNGDRDGIPNVLVEAMAMGLPVISTDISGIPELIDHGKDGLLVPEKNPAALADAMNLLLKDAALRERLSLAGREKIRTRFDAETHITPLYELFASAIRLKY
jgi:glycosyltransferase involved in cell wall biosynthesis